MNKQTFITCLFFVLTLQLNSQINFNNKIDSLLNTCHKRGIFNGNALVLKNDKIIFRAEKGFTEGSKLKVLGKYSMFDIGSISKEFSAVGIMILKERGLLNLEDKISKYKLGLPKWSNDISIKNLLQYSSGLSIVDWENVHSDNDVYENLKKIKTLEFEPSKGYLYSSNNIFLQRRIIEKITKKAFNKFIEQNVFIPIGMNNSVIDHQYEDSNFVRGFNSQGINDEKMELKMSGSVCPSIDDLSKWVNQLLSYNIISKKSLYQLFESYSKNSQSALGNGTFTDNELSSYVHHGSSLSYESIVYSDLKEKTMIILMTNSKSLKIGDIAEAIMHILKGEDYKVPQKSVYLTIREKTYNNVDSGIEYYKTLKRSSIDVYNFSNHWELAQLSYKLFQKNQLQSAIKILELLVAELPIKSEEALGYLGSRILNENQIKKSISVYKLMIEKFPSGKSYEGLGNAYYKNKQFKMALFNYNRSIEIEPENDNVKKMILEIEKM